MELTLILLTAFGGGFCIGLAIGGRQARQEAKRREAFIADLRRHNEVI